MLYAHLSSGIGAKGTLEVKIQRGSVSLPPTAGEAMGFFRNVTPNMYRKVACFFSGTVDLTFRFHRT
jgi:hypothetical protein